ncbi:OsmC/Ohr family [Astrocystis sublimbata]|nr:OsmC/Ohr family [Astrocystis sublimbata]
MASSTRCLRPLLATAQRAPRLITQSVLRQQGAQRFLNTETAPVLYSAHATVKGARTGHVEGDDLKIGLTMAKALGGAGDKGKTNPEELFAAGYGACFQSAMNAAAASMGIKMPSNPEDSIVNSTVHLVGDMKNLDMGIRVDMKVSIRGLKKDQIQEVVAKAEEICPYSRATRGNVKLNVECEQL